MFSENLFLRYLCNFKKELFLFFYDIVFAIILTKSGLNSLSLFIFWFWLKN
jgi:hypothetical protein